MTYLPPYALFGSRTALEDGRIDSHIERWREILDCLQQNRLDLERAAVAEKLNECLQPAPGVEA